MRTFIIGLIMFIGSIPSIGDIRVQFGIGTFIAVSLISIGTWFAILQDLKEIRRKW